MDVVRLLWIDLCSQSSKRELFNSLSDKHDAVCIDRFEDAASAILQFHPHLACIDFDYPDRVSLQTVPEIKRTYPMLPLLMFTEYHSEALAVWAFRSGVWDYRVKPITSRALRRSIEVITENAKPRIPDLQLRYRLPEDLIEPAGHLQKPPSVIRATNVAVIYIAKNFCQNITRDTLAGICHLSASAFTRAFRKEQGTTFEHFLLEYRLGQARSLLAEPQMTVSRAAYSSGFNDTSYFSRAFKQQYGITPSAFQREFNTRLRDQILRANGLENLSNDRVDLS